MGVYKHASTEILEGKQGETNPYQPFNFVVLKSQRCCCGDPGLSTLWDSDDLILWENLSPDGKRIPGNIGQDLP